MRSSNDVCIFRTGRLWDADMVCAALEEENVPYYRRQETSSGLEFAMSAAPTAAPGVWFTVWVSRELESEARAVLSSLPLDLDRVPDVVDFSSSRRARVAWRLLAGILLVFLALSFYQQCARNLRTLFQ